MKKTYAKNILRSVKGTFSRFIAIFAITALGVGFLAGLLSTTPDMRGTIDKYYDDHDMMDIYMKSTWGFDEADIAAVEAAEGIGTVMPHYVTDVLAAVGEDAEGNTTTARLYGLSLDALTIGKMELVEGRMPASADEILAEKGNGMFASLPLGTVITLQPSEDAELSDTYSETRLTVVGIVTNPYYMSVEREGSSVGNGRVGVMVYGMESLYAPMEVYTDLFVTAAGAKEMDTYSDAYWEKIDALTDALERVGDTRSVERLKETQDEAYAEIAENEAEYRKERADAQKELADAKKELDDAEAEIADGWKKVSDGRAEIEDGRQTLADNRETLDGQYAQLRQAAAMMPPAQYAAMLAQLDAAAAQLDDAERELAEAEAELAEAEAELRDGEAELADGRQEYLDAKAEAEAEFADAEEELAEAKADVAALAQPEWFVLTREETVSFVSFDSNAEKIHAIAQVFPLFFFLVAVLVALTTMTRMIEEERGQIGILKALGYSRGAIIGKYILYAGVSGLLGSFAGLAIGLWLFPTIVWAAYSIMYTFPPITIQFIPHIAMGAAAAAIACVLLATLWAGAHILSEKPASLLLPRAPKAGKRVLLEYITPVWHLLGFNGKVTVRNLFRYKKRFFMTVIGIAGCTALLVTGFGLRDSIGDIVNKQFNQLMRYNLTIETGDEDRADLDAYLADPAKVTDSLASHSEYGTIYAGDEHLEVNITVPEETAKMTNFIVLRERVGGEALTFDENSLVLSEKMASLLGLSAGDVCEIESDAGERAAFTVTGITENYVQSYAYMPRELYTAAFDTALDFSSIMVKSTAASSDEEDAELTELLTYDCVSAASYSTSMSKSFDDMLDKIDYIVIVLIVCAGLLAFVVLYNLTNINIAEREKELATIKVLGFFDGEVASYVYRETAALSVIGTLAGLVLGIALHRFVVLTAEMDTIMFGREIYPVSFLLSALITLVFSALVCLAMAKKLRDIDMVESMKANE